MPRRIQAILVHGTFAYDTRWDDADALLSTRLRERLAERDVALKIREFRWTGENSHSARRAAALRLADFMARVSAEPEASDGFYLIGHSHGGTVARLATCFAQTEHGVRPSGVVTLGAPFVRFAPRPVSALATVLLWLVRALFFVAFLIAASSPAIGPTLTPEALGGPQNLRFLGGLLIAGGVLWLIDRAVRRGRDRLVAIQSMLKETYDPAEAEPAPFLCVHAVGDEASLLLRFWTAFSRLFHALLKTLLNSVSAILLLVGGAMLVSILLATGIAPRGAVETALGPVVEAARGLVGLEGARPVGRIAFWLPISLIVAGLATFLALAALTFAAAPLAVLAPWLVRKQWFAFGGERMLWNLASDIHVDRLPHRNAELRLTFLPGALLSGRMQHSHYPYDPGIIDAIAERLDKFEIRPSRPAFRFGAWLGWLLRGAVVIGVVVAVLLVSVLVVELGAGLGAPLAERLTEGRAGT